MGNKKNKGSKRKLCRNKILRNIHKRGRGARPGGRSKTTVQQDLQNNDELRPPGSEMSKYGHPSEFALEPESAIDIKIEPGTEETDELSEFGLQQSMPIGNSGETLNLETVETSLVEVKSIIDLLNWLDSCGTIILTKTETDGDNDEDPIQNQIFRFYSEIFKGHRYQTHDLRQRKCKTAAGITPRKNSKRTCKTPHVQGRYARPEILKKLSQGNSNSNNPTQASASNEIGDNSEGLNQANQDWTLLFPTINGGPIGTTGRDKFPHDIDDFDNSISSPPNFDEPAIDDLDREPVSVTPHPNLPLQPEKKKRGSNKPRRGKWIGPDVCELCGKMFNKCGNLERHMETHNDVKNFVCQTCGKGFHCKRNLRTHEKLHVEGARKYLCDQCPNAYIFHHRLVQHQLVHSEIRKYVCHICGKGFLWPRGLRDHLPMHSNERPLKCTYCPKAFKRADHLTAHIRIHTGEKRYKCEPCGMAFVQIGSLIFHNRTHHGIVKPKKQY